MNTDTILTGISIVAFVVLLFVMRASRKRYRAWMQQSEVGLEVFAQDCTMLDDLVSAPLISADEGLNPQPGREQFVECPGGVHDVQAQPLGDGRWLHECVRCHLVWRIDHNAPVHDCDGCDDCGAPMLVDEQVDRVLSTVCADCKGERVFRAGRFWWYCPACCCDRCGQTTPTAPLCADCADDEGDRVYERRCDR